MKFVLQILIPISLLFGFSMAQVRTTPQNPVIFEKAKPTRVTTAVPQQSKKFIHVASSSNTKGHITTINSSATNNNPRAILIVEQLYGTYNTHEIGVQYREGKWRIVNQDRAAIPRNAKFNVLVLNPSKSSRYAFVHTTSTANTKGHYTIINSSLTNAKPGQILIISKRMGKFVTSPVGVWYTNGKWAIYNENRAPMPIGTQFNIIALTKGSHSLGLSKTQGSVFQTVVSAESKKKFATKHVSYLNNRFTNNQSSTMLFATHVWKGKYNRHPKGVWYSSPNWTVFNQDRREIPTGTAFNYIALRPQTTTSAGNNVVISQPTKNPVYTVKPGSWQVITTPSKNDKPSNTEPTSKEPEGPNLALGKELGGMLGDPSLGPFIEKLNLFREIYEDKNPNSNVYYYLPGTYALDWDKDGGVFALFFYYLSAGANGRGDVIVTAEFSPKLNQQDLQIAEELLQKKLRKPVKLEPMPLRNTPQMDLGSSLGLFDVDPASVSTNIPTDILKPIVVSWKMGKRVDDLIGFLLSRNQVSASMEFEPYGDDEKKVEVPVRMKINDSQTYGKLEFDNASKMLNGFQNPLDFPIVLESLGIIRNKNGSKKVETVSLNNYTVQPKSYFSEFSSAEREQILGGDLIEELWLNYNLVSDCEDCGKNIKNKILGGTSSNLIKELQIEVLTPIEYSGAQMIKLKIKSTQADPKGEAEEELPIITITQDFASFTSGELFVPEEGELDYEYELVLIMPDANVYKSGWQKASDEFLVLGESTISELFPSLIQSEEEMEALEPEEGTEDPDEGND